MERSAYLATAWRLGRYYRTYPAYVEDEVRAALEDPDGRFERGPVTLSARGTATDDRPAFVVHDRNYVSSRWPGDAYLFGRTVRDLLQSQRSLSRTDRSIRADHSLGAADGEGGGGVAGRAVGRRLGLDGGLRVAGLVGGAGFDQVAARRGWPHRAAITRDGWPGGTAGISP